MKRRLLAAWWAFWNPDRLSMLRHELTVDATLPYGDARSRAYWYLKRYLHDLPIE